MCECVHWLDCQYIFLSFYVWFRAAGRTNAFGWEHSGARNQLDKDILKKPFLSCCELMPLSCLSYTTSVYVSECIYLYTSVRVFYCVCVCCRPQTLAVRSVKVYALWENCFQLLSFCCLLAAGSFWYRVHHQELATQGEFSLVWHSWSYYLTSLILTLAIQGNWYHEAGYQQRMWSLCFSHWSFLIRNNAIRTIKEVLNMIFRWESDTCR